MGPFMQFRIKAMIEDIKFLESGTKSSSHLYSDLKAIKEEISVIENLDWPHGIHESTGAVKYPCEFSSEVLLQILFSLENTMNLIEHMCGIGELPVNSDWISKVRRVIEQSKHKTADSLRKTAASRIKGLYVIVDPEVTNGRPVLDIAEAVLRGGASVIQFRSKVQDKGDILAFARNLKELCDSYDALFIINDDADVALAVSAHGLHVGQTDLPVSDARLVLTDGQIIGRSNNNISEVLQSDYDGADYIAVGAIFTTSTMGKRDRTSIGVEVLGKVRSAVSVPIVAIGGINKENIQEVVNAGAECVCVVSAVTLADKPEFATRELVRYLH